MEILGWIFAIMLILGFLGFAAVFGPIVFVEQIGTVKLKLSEELVPLMDGVQITEISDNEQPLPYEHDPGTGDVAPAETMLLAEDGTIEKDRRLKEGEKRRVVHVLSGSEGTQSVVVDGNEIYRLDNDRLGEHLGTFSGPAIRYFFHHVTAVKDDTLLVAGALADVLYTEVRLYQINLPELHQQELAADPYYFHSRKPKIFKPAGFNGAVLVYYTGSFDFAAGGDSSRPKFSVIRIYNGKYPKGQDIVKLGFKAGTVVNVTWQDDALILHADPSLPLMVDKPRAPARVWRLKVQ